MKEFNRDDLNNDLNEVLCDTMQLAKKYGDKIPLEVIGAMGIELQSLIMEYHTGFRSEEILKSFVEKEKNYG